MISRSEIKTYTNMSPKFDDIFCSLQSAPKLPKGMIKETKKVIAIARKFNKEVIRPHALALDLKMHENPEFLPWDFVEKANEWGFYTMWIPKIFGGKGYNMPSMSYFVEEIGSACLAMANLIGVHYLGLCSLTSTWHMRLINRLCRDVAAGEKIQTPCLISLAITEPGAGTDVEEMDLADKGNITCHAEKITDGYRINGTKIFISNGHLSTWHIVIAYSDLDKPSENSVVLAVKTGTKGFSFGRKERKMGQKGCPASELIFKDCFVPDDQICLDPQQIQGLKRSKRDTAMQMIDYVLAATRAGVGAFGTGAARGAYEVALKFASETVVAGKLLINHEWAQCMLAEMYKNIAMARLTYAETNYANGLYGSFREMQKKPMYYYYKFMPAKWLEKMFSPMMDKPMMTKLFRKKQMDGQTDDEIHRTSGWGSLAKFSGTDIGIKNCHMALEMMGQAGLRHDRGAEKILRDAKLLQIYEGTNQLNRLNLFKCLIAGDFPQAVVFDE
ncbi:MAG: acyl-CoA/acyl-ACP dehydrogenase [Desulfobacteraceae bacterium]|nr:acyl-CoA/acyl-ACP dehydrogenase [Desulfobacteraceae bacterium]MBC2756996.1 acyl-CoA/acyl-ACP dehydrogenase [Desulfobacteraceae bacterium]